jgi:hypothetical protein
MKLQMKREALQKINRTTNEEGGVFAQPGPHLPWAKSPPFQTVHRLYRLSLFSTTWGICFRSKHNLS